MQELVYMTSIIILFGMSNTEERYLPCRFAIDYLVNEIDNKKGFT